MLPEAYVSPGGELVFAVTVGGVQLLSYYNSNSGGRRLFNPEGPSFQLSSASEHSLLSFHSSCTFLVRHTSQTTSIGLLLYKLSSLNGHHGQLNHHIYLHCYLVQIDPYRTF